MAKGEDYNSKPTPDGADGARWRHTGLRRRMMHGEHEDDLRQAIRRRFSKARSENMGEPDMSSNAFRHVNNEIAVLYDEAPEVSHVADANIDALTGATDAAGLFESMPRFQAHTLGMREHYQRIEFSEDLERLVYRPVFADSMIAIGHPDAPDHPVFVRELRRREEPETGKPMWAWDEFDIRDPDNPRFRVLAEVQGEEGERDVSEWFDLAGQFGAGYQWRDGANAPFIPGVLYHAVWPGDRMFDARQNIELIHGSLICQVLFSMAVACMHDASFPQRYAVNAKARGAKVRDLGELGRRQELETAPGSILLFDAIQESAGQALIGQFAAGCDVKEFMESVIDYEARVWSFAGISAASIQREAGQARSGYSISMNNAGKRESQAKYRSAFARADRLGLEVAAKLLNRNTGAGLPESGYRIRYQSIPQSPEERRADRDDVIERMDRRLLSPVDAFARLERVSREEAIRELDRIRAEFEQFGPARVDAAPAPASDPERSESENSVVTPTQTSSSDAVDAGAPLQPIETDEPITPPATPVANVAMNGAQVAAAKDIVLSVGAGELPRDSGIQMLMAFFSLSAGAADGIMGEVGRGFQQPQPPPPAGNPAETTETPKQ